MHRRLLASLVMFTAFTGVPAVALAQTSIAELGAANAARNQMMADNAGTGAAAAPQQAAANPPTATPAVSFGGMKYTLSYALSGMLIGLGIYLVCRPANRHAVE